MAEDVHFPSTECHRQKGSRCAGDEIDLENDARLKLAGGHYISAHFEPGSKSDAIAAHKGLEGWTFIQSLCYAYRTNRPFNIFISMVAA